MEDPKLTIKDLIKDGWNAANVSSVTPSFSTGWFDRKATHPQITVTNPDEMPVRGGETGYSGIKADGSGPTQTRVGGLLVNCWAHRDDGSGVNPKQLTWEMSEEVERIILANFNQATDLDGISFGDRIERIDDSVSPAVYRYECTIIFWYQKTP